MTLCWMLGIGLSREELTQIILPYQSWDRFTHCEFLQSEEAESRLLSKEGATIVGSPLGIFPAIELNGFFEVQELV